MTPTRQRTFGASPFGVTAGPLSLGKPTAAYPGAVATDSDMTIAVDRQQTRLALPMNTTDTSMTVVDPSIIVAYCLLTIDAETVKVTGAPVGNVVPISRAFDGTTAAVHLASAVVSGFIDAYHHNRLVAEVEAIEQTLGVNLSRIPAVPFSVSSNYVFPAQTPGGSLVVGNNSITLTPVPKGVNGTDPYHYLYISGGTGATEAVLITGGTAVSGAASGTVIVTCANAHSGAWTIQTATSGIQEALSALPSGGGMVVIPAGSWPTFATITVYGSQVTLTGLGESSVITCTGGTYDCIVNTNATGFGTSNTVRDLKITGSGKTAGYGVRGNDGGIFVVEDVHILSMPNGITLAPITVAHVNRITIENTPGGYGISIFGGGDHVIENVLHDNHTGNALAGIAISATGGSFIHDVDTIHCDTGLLINPPSGANVIALVVNNAYFDSGGTGIRIAPAGAGGGGAAPVTDVRLTDCWTSSNSQQGVYITGSEQGVVFQGLLSFANAKEGVLLGAGSGDVRIMGSTIAGNSQSSAGGFNNITVAPGVSNFRIQNNVVGGPFYTVTDKAAYAIQASGASSAFYIMGNLVSAGSLGTINDTSTGPDKMIGDNLGASNAVGLIASAGTIAIPANRPDVIVLTGTTAIVTITGGYGGARVTFIKTDAGSISFTGGNIAAPATLSQFGSLNCLYNANFSLWFCK